MSTIELSELSFSGSADTGERDQSIAGTVPQKHRYDHAGARTKRTFVVHRTLTKKPALNLLSTTDDNYGVEGFATLGSFLDEYENSLNVIVDYRCQR
jgi:hypothetical protein